jgi:hypothetical protein
MDHASEHGRECEPESELALVFELEWRRSSP